MRIYNKFAYCGERKENNISKLCESDRTNQEKIDTLPKTVKIIVGAPC
jgi:hypothetical protein